jgi:hypothetical protein
MENTKSLDTKKKSLHSILNKDQIKFANVVLSKNYKSKFKRPRFDSADWVMEVKKK